MNRRVTAKILSALSVAFGLALLASCQAMGPGGVGGGGAPGAMMAADSGASGGGSTGATDTVADSKDPHGGSIGANVGSMDIQPCKDSKDPSVPCLTDEQIAALMATKTVGKICTQEAFRKACWGKDFRKSLGLDQKSDQELYDAISQGQLPEDILGLATFLDHCVEHVDVATLGSSTKDGENFCLFVRPASESLLLGGVDFSTTDDFRNAFAGAQFLAFTTREAAASVFLKQETGDVLTNVTPQPGPAIKRPSKE